MNRRALLAAVGATAVGTAGCLDLVARLGDGSYEWIRETGSLGLTVSRGRVFGREPVPSAVGESVDGGDGSVFALEAETGDRLWTYGAADPSREYAPPTVRDGVYTSYGADGTEEPREIHALEFDGALRWDDVRGRLEGIDDGVAYVTANRSGPADRELRALGTTDGEPLWRADDAGAVLFDRTETGGHDTVYVAGDDLVALDRADGSVEWRYDREAVTRAGPVVDGVVYATTDDAVVAVADGSERWRAESAAVGGVRGVESDRVLVEYAPDRDASAATSELRALETETGTERWRWTRAADRRGTRDPLLVDSRAGVVYVGDDRLVALEAADGTERWSDRVAEDEPVASLAIVDWAGADVDHALAATTAEGEFGMYDPRGERFCSDAFEYEIRDVAVAELVFVATADRIYAFDAW